MLTKKVQSFCKNHAIQRMEVFGSAVKGLMRKDSDVDLLVTFRKNASVSLFDLANMKMELEKILGRAVDLIERSCVEQSTNPFRKKSILNAAKEIYAA